MATHYQERLERDLDEIRRRVEEIAAGVDTALRNALRAVLIDDGQLAAETVLGDLPINRSVRALDGRCHVFVAQHLPGAGHLRFVSSVLRLAIELERIGDYAVTVAREQAQLSSRPSPEMLRNIELLGDQAITMFRQSVDAFKDNNAELARGTMTMAPQVERTFQNFFHDLLQEGEKGDRPIKDHFATLSILNCIGRVAAQSKNICEETLFAVSGETKGPKIYRVLFVDQGDDALTQLAVAYARRAYPEGGSYSSAGWKAADKLEPRCRIFLENNGFDTDGLDPTHLASVRDTLGDVHVVVGLGDHPREQVGELPFRTVLVSWDLGVAPNDLDQERAEAALEAAIRRLKVELGDLMQTLRGEEAS